MPNFTESTNINPRRFVTPTSRYIDSKVVYYTEKKYLTFTTFKKKDIPVNANDKFMVITKGVEYRPDLVSFEIYTVPDYWWLILQANNMKDVYDFKAGLNIRLPAPVVWPNVSPSN